MEPMSERELDELEKNIITRTKVDALADEVKELNGKLTKHMELEDIERRKIDKKLLYLFLISTGSLAVDHGSGLMLTLAKMFLGG